MANPLFHVLNNVNNKAIGNNHFSQLFQQFQNFRKNFKGDPQQTIQQMLLSGSLTQEQLNYAQSMAQQFMAMMPK